MKFDLNKIMQEVCYHFCMRYKDWIIDDWKNVIWNDEINVILNSRRDKRLQWRTANEKFNQTCIRRRWKDVSKFMFWNCVTYDKKNFYHIWKSKTATQKRTAQRNIDEKNETNET